MKLPQLTFTRFLAALLIVLFHIPSRTLRSLPLLGPLLDKAQVAVSYFFLLSGFILVMANASGTILPKSITKRQFWINRFARIYPLYLVALLATWLLVQLTMNVSYRDLSYLGMVATEMTLLQAWVQTWVPTLNYPGWSLSVEAFFYLIFPFLYQWLVTCKSRQIVGIGVLIWLANQLIYKFLTDNTSLETFRLYFPVLHLGTFVVGVCTGILTLRHWQVLLRSKSIITAVLVGITLLFAYLIGSDSTIMYYYHNGLFAPLFVVFILFLSVQQGALARWLSHPKLVYLGEISYGIYLLQVPVGMAAFYLNQRYVHLSPSLYGIGYVALLFLIAALCFEKIEKPGRRLLRKWLSPASITTAQSESPSQQLTN
ncbi:acyltransferase family protein [Spirosoma endophyticum]|uniref:Peptidoglycan/LPS O-acetylase OafA/YrhL, contains acyltransferase and SGNH-hydrolase domains n=1 Tax=Spirosoma endophyticum TaxID=662367 RepID=A0A1I2AQJ8_9BACT|nr:acyltransferase [Spirosoma endophyticum]SFE46305.1 Peptidoglycan/LPS O-acetylase OafA/YrhL, contains acyltransferase and SGNH-hydrolase domains [Spirosoma endophyticum]